MTLQPDRTATRDAGSVRLLCGSIVAALMSSLCLVLWAVDVRTSTSPAMSGALLEAIADARVVGSASSVRSGTKDELSALWTRAIEHIVVEASRFDDEHLRARVGKLAASADESTVTRLAALEELEDEARVTLAAADLDARRASGRTWLVVAAGLGALTLLGLAGVASRLNRLEAEQRTLDAMLPRGHRSEGLVTRASRLTGRASSLLERQSSLVNERFGLVRALADIEENERRLVAETRLHRDEIERLQVSQMRDELTGVLNFKYFLMRLSEALDEFIEGQRPFCLLALDLDDFKGINDGYGHHVGDAALRAMGRLLGERARDGEIVFRKSGDEFYVLMPGASAAEAVSRAESLLAAVNGHEVTYEAPDDTYRVHLATSIGVLHCEQVDKTLLASLKRDQLLSETYGFADAALFKAKYNGKGCARIYTTGLTVVEVNPKEFPPDFDALHRGLKSKYPLLSDEAKDEFNRHLAGARRILSGR